MASVLINQSVDVHSLPPAAGQISGVNEGEEHVHSFDNLIPACEFAVSLAGEGHSNISLRTELERAVLNRSCGDPCSVAMNKERG